MLRVRLPPQSSDLLSLRKSTTDCRVFYRGATLECRDRDKNTPLLIAGRKNHVDSVMFLLKNGADPSAKDKNDRNVYHHTAVEGCLDSLKVRIISISHFLIKFNVAYRPIAITSQFIKLSSRCFPAKIRVMLKAYIA